MAERLTPALLFLLATLALLQVDAATPGLDAVVDATLPESTDKQTGILLPNPASPTCEVGMDIKIVNATVALQDPSQPTASPVPSIVLGNLSLQIAHLGGSPLQGPYAVTMEVPFGVLLSNMTGASSVTDPETGNNGTLAYTFTSDALLLASGGNTVYINMSIFASSQDFSPRTISINGSRCALGLTTNVTASVPNLPVENPGANLSSFAQLGYVGTQGNRIIDVDGFPITLNGVNWFGFETQANMVDGLYAGDSSLTADFATVAYRIQLLGFNAIRLPFSFVVLFQSTPTSYTRSCRVSSASEIRSNVIDPRDAPSIPAAANPPGIVAPPTTFNSGTCNDYVPNNSIYTRFLYVVGYLARQGFYILIDNHANTDPTVVNNPGTWLAQWTQLMRDITADPIAKARVMVDILNEPDSRGLRWENTGPLYLSVMDAVYQFSPTTLFFIEGMAQSPIQMCWGDGFVTNATQIQQNSLSDPRPFFNAVLQRPYLNNVVISPHYYGPSISGNTANYLGAPLAFRASSSWGYLNTVGYGGHIFPVVIGETGSQFITQGDLEFYADFAEYLNNRGALNDGRHSVTLDLFWWSWNSNSGDTGGLVDTTWVNVIWNKTEYLETAVGLRPWSLIASGGAAPVPTSPATQQPTPAPPTVPVPLSPGAAPPTNPSPTPLPTIPPSTGPAPPTTPPTTPPTLPAPASPTPPVVSPPQTPPTTPESRPPSSPSPPQTPSGGPGSCAARYSVDATWLQDTQPYAVLNLFITSTSADTIQTPYSVAVTSASYTGLTSTWNWAASFSSGGTLSGASESTSAWETLQPNAGNTANLGFIAAATSADAATLAPQSVSVNGVSCSLSA